MPPESYRLSTPTPARSPLFPMLASVGIGAVIVLLVTMAGPATTVVIPTQQPAPTLAAGAYIVNLTMPTPEPTVTRTPMPTAIPAPAINYCGSPQPGGACRWLPPTPLPMPTLPSCYGPATPNAMCAWPIASPEGSYTP